MTPLKIAEFRDKISLQIATVTVDNELNRIENIQTIKTVWANVECKNSNIQDTEAGHKPQLKYKITIRKQTVNFEYILYHGKRLIPTGPWYEVDNKYIVVEAVEIV